MKTKIAVILFFLILFLMVNIPIQADSLTFQATTWACLSGIPARTPAECQPQPPIYLNNGPAPTFWPAPVVTPITYPPEIPVVVPVGPSPIPVGYFRVLVEHPVVVYPAPSYYHPTGTIPNGQVVLLQHTNVWDQGLEWYWIRSGDYLGQFLSDNGSLARLP